MLTGTAMRSPHASPVVMRGQIDRLLAVADLPTLRLGIIPLGQRMPIVLMHDFSIQDDSVRIGLGHTEMTTPDPEDVALYNKLTDRLWTVAVEGDEARALLARAAADLAG